MSFDTRFVIVLVKKRECLISLSLVIVGLEDFPAGGAHETWRRCLSISCHLAHLGARNEVKVLLDTARTAKELHLLINSIISSNLEWKHLDTVEHGLAVDEELLAVPDVVKIDTILLGVLHASWVTTGNEVCDAAVDAG